MISSSFSSRYADTGHSAYHLLHHPAYTPQPPTDNNGTLENILNPSPESTNLLPGRRAIQRQPNVTTSAATAARRPQRDRTHTALSKLIADEESLAQKKTNIARFGSTWLRPPGILKTRQMMDDEEAEAREQEATAAREERMAEERAAQEAAERAAGGNGGVGMDGEEAMAVDEAMERDLDEEIPGAQPNWESGDDLESEGEYVDEDEEEDIDLGEREADVPVQSVEDLDMDGAMDRDLSMEEERNLDDSVPEAGSYEHTDTELDESSDVDDSRMSGPLQPVVLLPPGSLDGHRSPLAAQSSRFSGSPTSLGLDSSALLSSPGAARGMRRGQPREQR